MYCSTITIIKSHHFVYTFRALLAAKCCCGKQVNKRQAAANAFALLSTVVVLEKMCKVLGGINFVGGQDAADRP